MQAQNELPYPLLFKHDSKKIRNKMKWIQLIIVGITNTVPVYNIVIAIISVLPAVFQCISETPFNNCNSFLIVVSERIHPWKWVVVYSIKIIKGSNETSLVLKIPDS